MRELTLNYRKLFVKVFDHLSTQRGRWAFIQAGINELQRLTVKSEYTSLSQPNTASVKGVSLRIFNDLIV